MHVNGLMIDCSRLLERHAYYFRLLDFMADWNMNTLVLHFADDSGCAIALPGFRELAMPHAFSTGEIRRLVDEAEKRGIEVIPELETFGHTRFITDRPAYRHLYAGRRSRTLIFNAIDPLHPDTQRLMRRLIRAVSRLFPSPTLHVGCDEVNLEDYCRRRGADAGIVWSDYVNRVFDMTRACGKQPMFWADHPARNARIAERLQKAATAVWWNYRPQPPIQELRNLQRAGFERIVAAPSTGCYYARFLTPRRQLANVRSMAQRARRYGLDGMINTVWTTHRYSQGAMYYGMAFAADAAGRGRADRRAFHARFADRVFGTELTGPLARFLDRWPDVDFSMPHALALVEGRAPSAAEASELRRVRETGTAVLAASQAYEPRCNRDIWDAMVLAAEAAWVCAEGRLMTAGRRVGAERRRTFARRLGRVRRGMSADWDATRYPDDINKRRSQFPGPVQRAQYALLLLRSLQTLARA